MIPQKTTNRNWLFWITLFILFCTAVYILRSVIMPFVAGIIIGYLFDPWVAKLKKAGINRTVGTFIVLGTVLIIIIPGIFLLLNAINEQIGKFLETAPQYIAAFLRRIEPVINNLQEHFPGMDGEKIRGYIRSNISNWLKVGGNILKSLISSGFALINILSLLLITPVVAFYILRDWENIVKKADSLLPRKSKESIRQQAKEIDRTLAGFIRGQLSVCIILGSFYALGLYFTGLELGLLIGFLAGLISFIPYIGSISGFIVSIAVALAQFDSMTPVFHVVGVFIVGQFLEGNFLTPKLVGDSVGLHPVWIMFALLAGGVLLGFLGLMIAVPVAAVIGVFIRHAIKNYKNSSLYLEK